MNRQESKYYIWGFAHKYGNLCANLDFAHKLFIYFLQEDYEPLQKNINIIPPYNLTIVN